MPEIISSGGDPDHRRRRPRSALVAVLATLIAGVAVLGYAGTRDKPAAHPEPTATSTPATTSTPVAAPSQPIVPAALQCGQPCDAPVLRAVAGTGPAGMRLLVNTRPTGVLTAAGKWAAGPQLPVPRGQHLDVLLPMGSAAVGLIQSNVIADATPPGRVYRLTPDGSVKLLGRADSLVPGVGATVWTVTYARSNTSAPGAYSLTEFDAAGRILTRHTQAAGTQVLRATRAGLFAMVSGVAGSSYFGADGSLLLLNPATGNVTRVLSDRVVALLDATDGGRLEQGPASVGGRVRPGPWHLPRVGRAGIPPAELRPLLPGPTATIGSPAINAARAAAAHTANARAGVRRRKAREGRAP